LQIHQQILAKLYLTNLRLSNLLRIRKIICRRKRDNIIFQKTSFLSGTNSSYIEKLYAKYVENPASIPDSWRQFFEGLGESKR
jgi:hypothetical protein